MSRLRDERGQAFVLTAVFMTALLGMAALVLDVGHWYRSKRDLQAVADAAALAGAQALPDDPAKAAALATQYTADNGGPSPAISITTTKLSGDTIRVKLTRSEPGFFAKIFNIDSVDIGTAAKARAGVLGAAQYAAPFGIDLAMPELHCGVKPCDNSTSLDLQKVGPGAFRILDIDGSRGGTGTQILGSWVQNGFGNAMPLGWYYSDSGSKFNSSNVRDAMNIRLGDELLFPVYDQITGQGTNLQYHVVGWAGFVVTSFNGNGNSGHIFGHFTKFIGQGLEATNPSPNLGAYTVRLVE